MNTGVNHNREILVSMHSAETEASIALCAAVNLPVANEAPEWVHLLPAGTITTGDGRGPYTVLNAEKLIASSIGAGDRLVIDENHATDLAAPRGESAPARGWIVGLQAREDGIWGQVEWTAIGRRLVAGKAYRGLSPVIEHLKGGEVLAIRRASLVNKPNLRGLTALHQEETMTLLQRLAAALGLANTVSEDTLVTAITALHSQQADKAVALQAQLAPIAKAAGVAETADASTVLTAIAGLAASGVKGDQGAVITGLQAEITTLAGELKGLRDTSARDKATAFVDAAIAQRKAGLAPLRDHYIAMHMENPTRVEKEIGAMVSLNASHTGLTPPPATDGTPGLTAEDQAIVAMMGLDPVEYAKTKKSLETAL